MIFAAQMAQFPAGFGASGALPGFSPAAAAANFTNFRPQYSVPGQPATPSSNVRFVLVSCNIINTGRWNP